MLAERMGQIGSRHIVVIAELKGEMKKAVG